MSGDTPATKRVSRSSSSTRVVEAGDEERHDLEPDAHAVQPSNGVEDGLEAAAELTIVAIVEALEIDLVEIDPRAQVLEHLRRAVAVGHERRQQAALPAPP